MNFEPRPENPFPKYIETYFTRCQAVCPKLRAIAGKWTFEDLIPGLSDFDARLIFADGVTVDEWSSMSIAVGKVHTELAKEVPGWARILEHLPGLNLAVGELTNPRFFYPEFQQWSYYLGDDGTIETIRGYLKEKPWTDRDEFFHLKKFSVYFGPYQRGIDPAVNIGPWESKYPLHSRFMHYFCPPVQSAVSLVRRRGIAGKLDALRQAREIFPNPDVIDMILEAVNRHYEAPEYYAEPRLTQIERQLEAYLRDVYRVLADHVTLIRIDPADEPEDLKAKVAAVQTDPVQRFYEGVKFSRFMKGRLLFYATPIAWFDTRWLIGIELGRIVPNFYTQPLKTFGLIRYKESLSPEQVLSRLEGRELPADICATYRQFAELAARPLEDGKEKQRAFEVAQIFDSVQIVIEALGDLLYRELEY